MLQVTSRVSGGRYPTLYKNRLQGNKGTTKIHAILHAKKIFLL